MERVSAIFSGFQATNLFSVGSKSIFDRQRALAKFICMHQSQAANSTDASPDFYIMARSISTSIGLDASPSQILPLLPPQR